MIPSPLLRRTAAAIAGVCVLSLFCPLSPLHDGRAGAEGSPPSGLHNSGVGIYTDASVADQVSSFTINPQMVSCGVGTLAPGPHSVGPFAMLMYATRIDSYTVDAGAGEIKVQGRMRSITRMGTTTVEDVEHDFLAIATDHRGSGPDHFEVHFVTPFWNPGNPMATHSTVKDGWVRFGGDVISDATDASLGEIVVDKS